MIGNANIFEVSSPVIIFETEYSNISFTICKYQTLKLMNEMIYL